MYKFRALGTHPGAQARDQEGQQSPAGHGALVPVTMLPTAARPGRRLCPAGAGWLPWRGRRTEQAVIPRRLTTYLAATYRPGECVCARDVHGGAPRGR